MASRVQAAAARKRGGARRPSKKKRSRRLGIFGLALLAIFILGFLVRRMMVPQAMHYLTHRPPESSESRGPDAAPEGTDDQVANPNENLRPGGDSEHLTAADRDRLNAIIKRRTK